MVKISVIVPVYNTELYLTKCIKSIMEQSFNEEYELILINDGSVDHSENIIDKMIAKYGKDKIIKINQQNSGQGKARNEGLKIAKGEYVIFIDSDDYIEKNMLEDLYKKAKDDNADLVICDYEEQTSNGNIYKRSLYNDEPDLRKNYIISVAGPCSKLVKTDILRSNNLFFPENIIYEDLAVVPTWAIFAEKLAYIQKSYYYYFIGNNSTMRQPEYSPKLKTIFNSMEHLEMLFKKKGCYEEYFQELEYLFIEHLLYAGTGRMIRFQEAEEDVKKIREIMATKFPNWKKNKYYLRKSFFYKLRCDMFFKDRKNMIKIYELMRSLRKR